VVWRFPITLIERLQPVASRPIKRWRSPRPRTGNPVRRPVPKSGILLTHFIVSNDIERSRRFYTEILGGQVVREGEPTMVALANAWVLINAGGGPTEDKPAVTLDVPSGNVVSSFLNIRVADMRAVYEEWSAKGAEFLTPPIDRGVELRCYLRDPDGHLIEVGQTTALPWRTS
jgi:catechol 2,3-dioxygenase-like lactoylglutathione lyase family enzyme